MSKTTSAELENPRNRVFISELFLPYKVEEIFPFFAEAKNLERITPPYLHFKIVHQSTPQIQEGSTFDYSLKIHGVPCKWRTLIEEWVPNKKFVDRQLKGPYSLWHHQHIFKEQDGGTLMTDKVTYRLPMGFLGDFVAGSWVDGDVKSIFDYREKVVLEIFDRKAT